MEQFIPKSVIVAEIEKRKSQNKKWKNTCKGIDAIAASMVIQEDINILSLLDNIEAKEVDLEEEIERVRMTYFIDSDFEKATLEGIQITNIAEHFFELGMAVSNPLTWEDMLIIHRCIKDAMNYNLYAFQSTDGQQKVYEEVLKRFKAQKGE